MSLQIRGIVPTDVEYTELGQLEANAQEQFFVAKAKAYLNSDLAADKLSDRFFEVLRFDLPEQSLFLRDETYRKASATGVDLSIGFDKSMSSLKNVIARQIAAGKSWDEILTTSDVLFLPLAGQALTEYSQASANIALKISELGAQGVPTATVEDKTVAIKILRGDLPVPEGVKIAEGVSLTQASSPSKVLEYSKKVFPIIRNWVVTHTTFTTDFENGLGSVKKSKGEDAGLVSYVTTDVGAYVNFVLQSSAATSGLIPEGEIIEVKCLLNGVAANQYRTPPYPNVTACGAMTMLASPLLTPNVVAWLLELDLSKPEQSSAAVDYLVKSAKSPDALARVLQGASAKEVFSIPSVVSTKEFRERYKKTRYSRAAAFFRTYFCDDMQPVILIDNSTKTAEALKGLKFDDAVSARAHEEVMSMMTPDTLPAAMKPQGAMTANQIAAGVSTNAHFKPECVACHRKLDPAEELIAGKVDFSSKPLEVVYDDADGVEVRVAIKDFSELNQIVVKQDRYVRCQSERMWAWTIGEDVSVDASRRAQLTKLYTDSGAKPREIMAALVNRPEFKSDESFTQPPTFSTVSSLLNRCNSCHAKEEDVPSFTTIPIDGDDHVRWLTKIAKSVSIGTKGVGAKMPKKGANWSLTEADRVALARWIWNGARDDEGKPTIDESDRTKILKNLSDEFLASITAAREPVPSFRPTWRRYMENYDILNVLAQKFPSSYSKCATGVEMKMRGTLGFKDKNSGVPTALTPGVSTVDWLNRCFYAVAQSEMAKAKDLSPWVGVAPETKAKFVSGLVDSLIGAGVLEVEDRRDLESTVTYTIEEIALEKGETYTTTDASTDAMFTILNDERFLTY